MEIIDVSKGYSKQIKELFEESFGKNYMSAGQVEGCIESGAPFKMALDGDTLMGAILFIPESEETIAEHTELDRKTIHALCGAKPSLICRCACTYARYQRKGVARQLLQTCLEEIKKRGYGAVFTTLWEYQGGVPAEKMFMEHQFQRGKKLEAPWYGDEDYICSECGGRCRCSGVVYYKEI